MDLDLGEDRRTPAVAEAHGEERVAVAREGRPPEPVREADDARGVPVAPHERPQEPREVALGLRDQRAARAVAEPLGVAVVVRAHLVGRAAEALPAGPLVRFGPQTRGRRRREAEGVERVLRGPRPVEHDLQVVGVVAPEPLVVVLEVQDTGPEGVGAELVEAAPVLEQRLQLLEQLQALRRRLPPERAHGAHAAGHVAAVFQAGAASIVHDRCPAPQPAPARPGKPRGRTARRRVDAGRVAGLAYDRPRRARPAGPPRLTRGSGRGARPRRGSRRRARRRRRR